MVYNLEVENISKMVTTKDATKHKINNDPPFIIYIGYDLNLTRKFRIWPGFFNTNIGLNSREDV